MEEVEMNQAILFVSHKDVNLIQRKKKAIIIVGRTFILCMYLTENV